MVGRDLRVRRFTRAIEPMLNLIPSDVGRSIFDLQSKIELPDLRRLLLDAMEGGTGNHATFVTRTAAGFRNAFFLLSDPMERSTGPS